MNEIRIPIINNSDLDENKTSIKKISKLTENLLEIKNKYNKIEDVINDLTHSIKYIEQKILLVDETLISVNNVYETNKNKIIKLTKLNKKNSKLFNDLHFELFYLKKEIDKMDKDLIIDKMDKD